MMNDDLSQYVLSSDKDSDVIVQRLYLINLPKFQAGHEMEKLLL